jgi:hypothetical protein
MFAPFAYFEEKNDIFSIELLHLKDNEAVLTKKDIRLCVPFQKIVLFRETGYTDSQNFLLYETDVIEIHFVYRTCILVGFTIIFYDLKNSRFTVEPFVGIFPETGDIFLYDEQYPYVFEFKSLSDLISSPSQIYRLGNYYEIEKGDSEDKKRAMYGIMKLKKDLRNFRSII